MTCGIVSGLVAFVASAWLLAGGVSLTPDGWAYWEGSVSLLAGKGYRYFGGQLITAWPPAFSWWLMGWQWVFGVSGGTLALASLVGATLAAFCWGSAWDASVRGLEARPGVSAALGTVIGISFASLASLLSAEVVAYLLLGMNLWLVVRRAETRMRGMLGVGLVVTGLLALQLLVKNSMVTLLPAVWWLWWRSRRDSGVPPVRWFLASGLPFVVAFGVWYGVRVLTGQASSHALTPESAGHGFGENLVLLFQGVGGALTTFRRYFDWGVGAGLILFLASWVAGPWRRRDRGALPRVDPVDFIVAGVLAGVCLARVLSLVWIVDTTASYRLVLPTALLLAMAIALIGCTSRVSGWGRCALLLMTALASFRAYDYVRLCGRRPPPSAPSLNAGIETTLGWTTRIDPEWYSPDGLRPPPPDTVAPPDYAWIRRKPELKP